MLRGKLVVVGGKLMDDTDFEAAVAVAAAADFDDEYFRLTAPLPAPFSFKLLLLDFGVDFLDVFMRLDVDVEDEDESDHDNSDDDVVALVEVDDVEEDVLSFRLLLVACKAVEVVFEFIPALNCSALLISWRLASIN